jgi:hypothetical protein
MPSKRFFQIIIGRFQEILKFQKYYRSGRVKSVTSRIPGWGEGSTVNILTDIKEVLFPKTKT